MDELSRHGKKMGMTKRSQGKFERKPRDFYVTPHDAVLPLLLHLAPGTHFHEPCAGDGDLVRHLEAAGHICDAAGDIDTGRDALDIIGTPADTFITNPPWDRRILHPLIEHLSNIKPTWLLFDADWMHTQQAKPYAHRCREVVSVGRVSWMGNGVSGFENCAWYLFDITGERTEFYWRI